VNGRTVGNNGAAATMKKLVSQQGFVEMRTSMLKKGGFDSRIRVDCFLWRNRNVDSARF
jgi:hypothetical protein